MTLLNILPRAVATALLMASVVVASSAHGQQVIFDDSFADGDRAQTGAMDTNWWTSSSGAGDEIAVGSLGLVTGGSGRGLHTVFPTQTLAADGDSLTATYTFTTPATVGSGSAAAFRVGLFDTLGRADLDADVSASSGTPNPVYGDTGLTPNTGQDGLPGYMLDHDVNVGDGTEDLNFRDHVTSAATGRLMATTGSGSFSSFTSGPDAGYQFLPNTTYTGSFTVERLSATEVQLTGTLGDDTYSFTDAAPDSFDFGMLAFHANSNQFGSSNTAGDPDNGIDFSNIRVETSFGGNFLLGDVNQDGSVNFLDISAFIAVLSGGGFQAEADTNEDGSVNFLDISAFIALLA